MRPILLCILPALVVPSLAAQPSRSAPAFEPAITPSLGVSFFGTRQASPFEKASYRGSLTLGARGELPLTQRVGIMASVALSPLAKQRTEDQIVTELHERVMIYRAEAALAWRFIPRAPVFFYGGGGVMGASKPAFPEYDQSVVEPRALFGVGYDRPSAGRWNFRVSVTGFITTPADPDAAAFVGSGTPPPVSAESAVFDWALEFGARYRPRRGS